MSGHGIAWRAVPAPRGRLYEGPTWIAAANAFQWVDILGATVHRWDPYANDGVESRKLDLEFATVALPLDGDRSLVASRSSLHEYSWGTEELATLGAWNFDSDVRFNDGAIAPNGDIYIGSMSMQRRLNAGALYRFDPGTGALDVAVGSVGISNGLAWTSESRAYYIDSLVPQIDVVTLSAGLVQREKWVGLGADAEPDGMAIDSDGSVLVALWGSGSIARAPSLGASVELVQVPPRYPTSVAVGGRANELLLLTSAACEPDANDADGFVFSARTPKQ